MEIRRMRKMAAAAVLALMVFAAGCGPREAGSSTVPGISADQPAAGGSSTDGQGAAASPSSSSSPSSSEASSSMASASPDVSAPIGLPGDGASGGPPPMPSEDTPPPADRSNVPDSSAPVNPAPPPSKPSPGKPAPPKETARTVTLSVVGNAEWGNVVAAENVSLHKNDTVSDVLIRTLKAHKLAYDIKGSGAMFYVEGIDGLFEFDDGPTSGWKYKVNGKVPGVGAGSYPLKPGDQVEWLYTSKDEGTAATGEEQAP